MSDEQENAKQDGGNEADEATWTPEEQAELGRRELGLSTFIIGGVPMTMEQFQAHQAAEAARIKAHHEAMYEDVVGWRMRAAAERGEPINEFGQRIEQAQTGPHDNSTEGSLFMEGQKPNTSADLDDVS